MKKLSDYKDEEAIDIWVELLEPISKVLQDEKVRKIITSGKNKILIATELIKLHRNEVYEILTIIDDTPIDGINLLIRLADVLEDIGKHKELHSFFGIAGQMPDELSTSVMENTEESEN